MKQRLHNNTKTLHLLGEIKFVNEKSERTGGEATERESGEGPPSLSLSNSLQTTVVKFQHPSISDKTDFVSLCVFTTPLVLWSEKQKRGPNPRDHTQTELALCHGARREDTRLVMWVRRRGVVFLPSSPHNLWCGDCLSLSLSFLRTFLF